jgi:hypothetical protein
MSDVQFASELPKFDGKHLFYPVSIYPDTEEGELRVATLLETDAKLANIRSVLGLPQDLSYYNLAVELIELYKLDASKFFPSK